MHALVGPALALACLLFALSLPVWSTGFGKTLRMLAGFLFLLALGPALFFGALQRTTGYGDAGTSGAPGASLVTVLAWIGALALLSVAAYVAVLLRGRKGGGTRDAMADYFSRRSSGKEPVADRREDRDGGEL